MSTTAVKPSSNDLMLKVISAKRVSTPLICINTLDPAATVQALYNTVKENAFLRCEFMAQWDLIRGIRGVGTVSGEKIKEMQNKGEMKDIREDDPVDVLKWASKIPPSGILIMHNFHRFTKDAAVVQATWNLRDTFKSNSRTLILLSPEADIPLELRQDILLLDEPLPNRDELQAVVEREVTAAQKQIKGFPAPDANGIVRAVDALEGLAVFPAEQTVAMSISKNGLDTGALWERKHKLINSTPGLSIKLGKETFKDIGGLAQIKKFFMALNAGNEPPRTYVIVDEIEKMLGGSGQHDTSGVSQGYLGAILTFMEEKKQLGLISMSPPGCGKSYIATIAGNEAGVPTIMLDLRGMMDSLVGSSERNLRYALKVIEAVSGGNAFWIATCNNITSLPPELIRRFGSFGTWFFDLPSVEERSSIWTIQGGMFGLKPNQLASVKDMNCDGWSPANIRDCCRAAGKLSLPVIEAAKFVTPAYASAGDRIDALRSYASGKFLSANYEGVYYFDKPSQGGEPSNDEDKGKGRQYSFLQ